MRKINQIVIHCSATRADRTLTPDDLETMHLTRPIERIGAHARGWNANSIGICYEGGLDCGGRPADTRTPEQRTSLRLLVGQLLTQFPGSRVCGHRDLSPDLNRNGEVEPEEWIKACPCFDVQAEFNIPDITP
ncbi:MAG TPA: N-acetylmuramoyl-L-alanine amidase [Bacteroides reticulotermitis]|nr:N-acetylmuramoyl-L-alanine amidase [Bacteroides reticulotermitis]